ncbi:MAG: hypothetical protein A2V77_19190 [Anaeromyxobacter sp. RBG_16_69_14]|nr:MAG: hypothetical protein A2V77_19190 [Anaeromyxobacter sp. RBG_16_69_14]
MRGASGRGASGAAAICWGTASLVRVGASWWSQQVALPSFRRTTAPHTRQCRFLMVAFLMVAAMRSSWRCWATISTRLVVFGVGDVYFIGFSQVPLVKTE